MPRFWISWKRWSLSKLLRRTMRWKIGATSFQRKLKNFENELNFSPSMKWRREMSKEPIRGKVARILNARELVINVGLAEGVAIGMYFDVLDPKGEDIKDPDSGEVL